MAIPPSTQERERGKFPEQLLNCLSIDLEIDVQSRMTALAAWRPDNDDELHFQDDNARRPESLHRVDRMSQNASFILGHNIIKFDIPHLRAISPSLDLLKLPAVDTLWLNPLAYPKRPYHRLVKHYKDGGLVRPQRNNPLLDSKLAFEALKNQAERFQEMAPEMLAAYHHLCTAQGEPGPDLVFSALRKAPRPDDQAGAAAIRNLLKDRVCQTHLEEAIARIPRTGWELAYATAWITIEERDSSLAPWVLYQFPETHEMIRSLRATACANPDCRWCRTRHDPKTELRRWFGFDEFRAQPATPEGLSIQEKVVTSALAQQDQLAILPTGSGKSLCYQLPGLSRYDQTGDLTVVISPLVALMEDQVRSMQQVHMGCVTINSLLSPQERMQNLNDVRQGQAAILLISPEQLRSRSVTNSLETRRVGLWVLDEAHCLSKWGHDFRPDYRYIGRWLRNHHSPEERGTVLCLTATAKPDVEKDITDYFTETLDKTLEVVDGGAERHNLDFIVVPTTKATRLDHISQLLREELDLDDPKSGGAIIYCSRRRSTEEVAEFLNQKGIPAERFHAGITGEEKRDIQERFVSGDLRILAATSAFGMGIDRPDIRLILHSDMPGSLENYIQEAGRAGRDQQHARCVLLYTPEDTEEQFSLNARARISRNDIETVLRALRRLEDRNNRHQRPEWQVQRERRDSELQDPSGRHPGRDTRRGPGTGLPAGPGHRRHPGQNRRRLAGGSVPGSPAGERRQDAPIQPEGARVSPGQGAPAAGKGTDAPGPDQGPGHRAAAAQRGPYRGHKHRRAGRPHRSQQPAGAGNHQHAGPGRGAEQRPSRHLFRPPGGLRPIDPALPPSRGYGAGPHPAHAGASAGPGSGRAAPGFAPPGHNLGAQTRWPQSGATAESAELPAEHQPGQQPADGKRPRKRKQDRLPEPARAASGYEAQAKTPSRSVCDRSGARLRKRPSKGGTTPAGFSGSC